MKIIGTGCGPGMLTEAAAGAIRSARLICGSKRAIELVKDVIPPECEVCVLNTYRGLADLPDHAVVLSTGDPMLAGLGLPGAEVYPGISSLQLACARLGIPLEQVIPVVAHGREHIPAAEEAIRWLRSGKVVCIIADPAFTPAFLAERLVEAGIETTITTCEDLGYPAERIARGTIRNPPDQKSRLFILIAGS